jgi:uncharacterized protein YbaP (TraB family)
MRCGIAKPRVGLTATLCFALLLALGLSSPASADGLIYRVSRADLASPSYLIGTMHSEDHRVTALLPQLLPLIEEVEVVAVELLPDAVTMLAVGAATLLPQDQSLRGLIGSQQFGALTDAAAALGLDSEVLNRLKPWAAAAVMGMPAAETGRFLDMEIYLAALERQRRVVGLESAAEQLAVFEGMPTGLQLTLLDEMIRNAEQLPGLLEELTSAYLLGDLTVLDEVARAQYAQMSPAVIRWFDEALIDERNARMVARISELLQANAVLIAVGAMHLGGESGLVAGLRGRGFRVERWRG